MRPTPSEVIAGVRRLLGEVVETCEIDDYARTRLSEMAGALGQIDWDDALTEVAAANAATASLIGPCLEWMDSDPTAHAGNGIDRAGLEGVLAGCVSPTETFAGHNERYASTQAAAVALSGYLAEWCRTHPDDEVAAAFLAQLRAHYSARRRRSGAAGQ